MQFVSVIRPGGQEEHQGRWHQGILLVPHGQHGCLLDSREQRSARQGCPHVSAQ